MLSMVNLHDTLLYDNVNPQGEVGCQQTHAAKPETGIGKLLSVKIKHSVLLKLNLFKPVNNRANVEVEPGVEKDEDSLKNDKQDVERADCDTEWGVTWMPWVAIQ